MSDQETPVQPGCYRLEDIKNPMTRVELMKRGEDIRRKVEKQYREDIRREVEKQVREEITREREQASVEQIRLEKEAMQLEKETIMKMQRDIYELEKALKRKAEEDAARVEMEKHIKNPVPEPCGYKQIIKIMWQVQLNGAFGLSGLPVCDQVIQAMEELDKKERVLFISYSYYTVRQAQPNDPFQNLFTYVALDHVYALTSKALYVLEWASGYGGTFGPFRLYGHGQTLPSGLRFRMNKCVDIPELNWKSVELYVKHTNGIIHAECPSRRTNIHMNIPHLKL
jgi:hypothetical protein